MVRSARFGSSDGYPLQNATIALWSAFPVKTARSQRGQFLVGYNRNSCLDSGGALQVLVPPQKA